MAGINDHFGDESPFTRPHLSIDPPSDASAIRVKVYNAVMRHPPPAATNPPSSPPSHPSSSSTLMNDRCPPASAPKRRASSKIYVLGAFTPQYMELTDSSDASTSSNRSIASRKTARSWLCRNKSVEDFRNFTEKPEETLLPSPRFSSRSFDGVMRRVSSNTDFDRLQYETQDFELDQYVGEARTPISAGENDVSLAVEPVTRSQQDGKRAYDAGKVSRLLNECLESQPCPPDQMILYRDSKVIGRSTRDHAPSSPTEGVRRVMDKHLDSSRDGANPRSSASTKSEENVVNRSCCGCGRKKRIKQWMQLIPCGHIICSTCLSASLSATTVSRAHSHCPSCHSGVYTFSSLSGPASFTLPIRQAITITPPGVYHDTLSYPVLRIDNVAWDITPQVVEDYLPIGTLPVDHPQPIHILLDRTDGRTKDYMYVEVADDDAVKRVLKHRQNSFMPGGPLTGGKKRPVTISPVPPSELLAEIRPRSAAELHSLLSLCQTAVSVRQLANPGVGTMPPVMSSNGIAHYVKSRHGPFYAVMSILSKLRGRTSPAYWDVFYMTSGALKALAQASFALANVDYGMNMDDIKVKAQDDLLFERLSRLFHATFREFKDRRAHMG